MSGFPVSPSDAGRDPSGSLGLPRKGSGARTRLRAEDIGPRIAAEAETWRGTPFRWQGSAKGHGCDCKGLVAGVARACDRPEAVSVEALAGDYGFHVNPLRLRRGLARLFDQVTGEPAAGDILLLKVRGSAQHLAIHAPEPTRPMRAIQAIHTGPMQVVSAGVPRDSIDSIWRWRVLDEVMPSSSAAAGQS